jgi:hypothetical protein
LNAVVTRQRQVKHFHGYAGLSNSTTWLHGNKEWETSTIRKPVFLLGQPDVIKGRQYNTQQFQLVLDMSQSVPVRVPVVRWNKLKGFKELPVLGRS